MEPACGQETHDSQVREKSLVALSSVSRLATLVERSDTFAPFDPPRPDAFSPSSLDLRIFQKVWPEAVRLRVTGELLRRVATLRCPVVALHGEIDPHPAQGVERPLSSCLPDFRFVRLERCGHAPWREKHAAERFYALLEEELES